MSWADRSYTPPTKIPFLFIYLYTNNIANILIEYNFSVVKIVEIFGNSKAFMKNFLKECALFR